MVRFQNNYRFSFRPAISLKGENMSESLTNWMHVSEQIALSHQSRIPWREIFGKSLAAHVYEQRAKGKTSDQIVDEAVFLYGLSEEAERRLRISVSSRSVEMRMIQKVKT